MRRKEKTEDSAKPFVIDRHWVWEAYKAVKLISIEGRSLIRTFLAGTTKDVAICLVSEEQAQNEKVGYGFGFKKMITIETMSRNSWTSQANEFEFSRSKILK